MNRNILTVPVRKVDRGAPSSEQAWLAVEEPLEIRLRGRNVAITMRTPGNDEELAAGFLFTEGILQTAGQVSGIAAELNVVKVALADDTGIDFERLRPAFLHKFELRRVREGIHSGPGSGGMPVSDSRPADDRCGHPPLIARGVACPAGGFRSHRRPAAALFDSAGGFLDVREDVGRHNAVDKLVGAAFLAGEIPLNDRILLVSGRVSFELVQKALMAGIAILAAVGAPSSLAVELALRFGMTLAGFVRDQRYNIYSGEWRLR
jgi:FdhD protein